MRTRSGKQYTALTCAPALPPSSTLKVSKIRWKTRALLEAAVSVENTHQTEEWDDTEGATLTYGDGDGGVRTPGIRRQARDLTLTAATPRPAVKERRPPAPGSDGNVELKRKRSRSNFRKSKKRVALAQSGIHGQPGFSASASQHAADAATTPVAFKTADVPAASNGGYVGKRIASSKETPWTLAELRGQEGFRYKVWDGRSPEVLTDDEDICSVVLVGQPEGWDAVNASVTREMTEIREEGLGSGAFKAANADHRRGKFLAVASGVSYGGGQMKPGNLAHGLKARTLIDRLIANNGVRRIAAFQNSAFACYAPKVYEYTRRTLKELYDTYEWLEPNFDKSVYSSVTFNCGPETACLEHTDSGNAAHLFCAITALGNYDPTQGGHLIIFPLKLIIEFPPGSTILIPSATIAHGNTPVGPNETRMSMTQYCAGGLFRWVEYGFCSAKSLLAQKGGREKRNQIDSSRAAWAMNLFSKSKELAGDRATLLASDILSTTPKSFSQT